MGWVNHATDAIADTVNHWGDAISGEVSHISDVMSNDALAKALTTAGVGYLTGGFGLGSIGSMVGSSLVDAGIVSSTAAANAVGSAIVQAGLSVASGAPIDKALENGALSVLSSQVIAPEVADEVKSVVDNPVVASMATNMGTNIATGVLQGKSQDEILNSAVAAGTSAVVNTTANTILANTPGLNDSSIPPEAKQIALAGIVGAIATGDGTKSMVNAAIQQGTKDVLNAAGDSLHPAVVAALQDSHDTAASNPPSASTFTASTDAGALPSYSYAPEDLTPEAPATDTASLASITTPDETSPLSSLASGAPQDSAGDSGSPQDASPLSGASGDAARTDSTDMGGGTGLKLGTSSGGLSLPVNPSVDDMGGGTGLIASTDTTGALPVDETPIDTNYGLSGNSKPTLDEMGGGTGLTATTNTSEDPSAPLAEPVQTDGLKLPTVPNDPSMGGGTGLTVPVTGGTMTGSGFVSDDYTPSLGDPKSVINGGSGVTANPPSSTPGKTTSAPPTTTPKATTGALPTTAATTSTTTPNTQSSPFIAANPQVLNNSSAAQQSPTKMAQLQQLYQSLTPEMQDAFAMHGIQEPQTAARGGSIGHYDTGGSSIPGLNDLQNFFTSATPKGPSTSPAILDAAKVVDQPSRIAALKQLRSGLSGQSQASGLAAGGLPHKYAEAAPEGHKPEFITGVTGYYAQGGGTGQSDDIPAMLHDGDYVIDAEAVSALGDGSSKAGAEALAKFQSQFAHHDTGPEKGKPVPAKIADGEYVFPAAFVTALGGGDNKKGAKLLDDMRVELRMHKRAAPTSKIPPKAESPLDYLKMAKG